MCRTKKSFFFLKIHFRGVIMNLFLVVKKITKIFYLDVRERERERGRERERERLIDR